jgi:Macrocin-O-methyltransferase (TylF)
VGYEYDFNEQMRHSIYDALSEGLEYVSVAAVPGDVAEFGVLQGATAEALARGMTVCDQAYGFHLNAHGIFHRTLHLFDSFTTFPPPDAVDQASPHVSSGIWTDLAFENVVFSGAQVRERCAPHIADDRLKIYEGFFDKTLPQIKADTKIALLHVDCDMYVSAFQVLTYVFENKMISDGCIVFFDDWNCNRASPRFGERRAWTETCQRFSIQASDEGSYGAMGHKFIVHLE